MAHRGSTLLLVVLLAGGLLGAGPAAVPGPAPGPVSAPAAADAGTVGHARADAAGGIPLLDGAAFDPAAWRALAGTSVQRQEALLPPGVDAYRVRLGADGTTTISPAVDAASAGALPGHSLALCTPRTLGLHYTTTLDQQDTCPFTWHDGPIDQTILVCVVAGDCTIAGQDAPTRGTFWVICHGKSSNVQAWGVLPAASVQCESGTIGATPQTWTHWTSWCRVFGLTDGTAVCAHSYG